MQGSMPVNENEVLVDGRFVKRTQTDVLGKNAYSRNGFFRNGFFNITGVVGEPMHSNYEGGLCQHSLNVYDALCNLANMYAPNKYDYSSLIVVALLHDLAKVNFYEKYIMNKKHYHPAGTKHDNQGNFDWIAEEAFKVRDAKERFLGGEHGFNSMIIANRYIPMTYEETLAILHHHCGQGESKQLTDLSAILNKYPLITLLHMADFMSTFITEVC